MASSPPIVPATESLKAEITSFQGVLDATPGSVSPNLSDRLSGPITTMLALLDEILTIYDADDDEETAMPKGFREAFRRGGGIVFDFGDD